MLVIVVWHLFFKHCDIGLKQNSWFPEYWRGYPKGYGWKRPISNHNKPQFSGHREHVAFPMLKTYSTYSTWRDWVLGEQVTITRVYLWLSRFINRTIMEFATICWKHKPLIMIGLYQGTHKHLASGTTPVCIPLEFNTQKILDKRIWWRIGLIYATNKRTCSFAIVFTFHEICIHF